MSEMCYLWEILGCSPSLPTHYGPGVIIHLMYNMATLFPHTHNHLKHSVTAVGSTSTTILRNSRSANAFASSWAAAGLASTSRPGGGVRILSEAGQTVGDQMIR